MAVAETEMTIGARAPDFELPATDGRSYALKDVAGENGTVIVFICNHCPYVKAVIGRLAADARLLMREGVGFAAVCSNDAASYPEDLFARMRDFAHARPPVPLSARRKPGRRARLWRGLHARLLRLRPRPQLKYRGRLDEGRTSRLRPAPRAPGSHARHRGPARRRDHIPSIGCSIKWKAGRGDVWRRRKHRGPKSGTSLKPWPIEGFWKSGCG